jgi:hypothetical protein
MLEVNGWMHIIDVFVHGRDTYLDDGMIHVEELLGDLGICLAHMWHMTKGMFW